MTGCALGEVVYSQYRSDPDYRDLLNEFVLKAADVRRQLQSSFTAGEISSVQQHAHQLRGAGGGYGFPLVSELAEKLESTCKATFPDLEKIAACLRDLDDCLSRLRL